LAVYNAKKRAEVAPGVGKATDMVSVGPTLGSLIQLREEVVDKLEQEYQKMIKVESAALERAKKEIGRYVDEFAKAAAESAAASSAGTAPQTPKGGDGSTPPDGGEIR